MSMKAHLMDITFHTRSAFIYSFVPNKRIRGPIFFLLIKGHTLYNVLLRMARNLVETREKVKISTHPFYHTNLEWFSWEWSKKKSKWTIFQNGRFSKSSILEIFLQKFHRLVLGIVGLIDAKAINVAQPIWLWGCLT